MLLSHWSLSYLIHVEDQIKLADIFKAFVECLDKNLDEVEDTQLRLWAVHTEHKIEGSIVTID